MSSGADGAIAPAYVVNASETTSRPDERPVSRHQALRGGGACQRYLNLCFTLSLSNALKGSSPAISCRPESEGFSTPSVPCSADLVIMCTNSCVTTRPSARPIRRSAWA